MKLPQYTLPASAAEQNFTNQRNNHPLYKAAIEYAESGVAVFLAHCKLTVDREGHTVKTFPAVKVNGVTNWRLISTTVCADIDAWPWHRLGPNVALCIDCEKSGLVVVDAEVGGLDTLAGLGMPHTRTATTPGGGRHLFYRADPDHPVKSKNRVFHEIDVKAMGGMVAAAPSGDERGQRAWEEPVPWASIPVVPRALWAAASSGAATPTGAAVDRDQRMFTKAEARAYVKQFGLEPLRAAYNGTINETANSTATVLLHFADVFWPAEKLIEKFDEALAETGYEERDGQIDRWHRIIAGEEEIKDAWKAERWTAVEADELEEEIAKEVARLRVKDEAKRRYYGLVQHAIPAPIGLDALLSQPDEPVPYRIDQLWPLGGNVLLAAQDKAGKTTTRDNLLRSLVDGDPFLGEYAAKACDRQVAILDFEMSSNTGRKWLRDQQCINTEKVSMWWLRGQESAFDLFDESRMTQWAELLRQVDAEVLILDCLGPWLASLGVDENENASVGRALQKLREVAQRGGVAEIFVIHHMGHGAERSRGASVLKGWPDASWRLMLQDPTNEDRTQNRYFGAVGRDVSVPECLLEYDADTRRLTLDQERRTRVAARRSATPNQGGDRLTRWAVEAVRGAGDKGLTGFSKLPGLDNTKKKPAFDRAKAEGLIEFRDGRWWLAEEMEGDDY